MGDDFENAPSGSRVKGGMLIFGVALAAVVAAVGYRSLDGEPAESERAAGAEDPIATLEARVEDDPSDQAAWRELGFARFDHGEYDAAAAAYRRAVELDPADATSWSALGEAMVMASERDPMPAEALAAFRKARSIDPQDPRARYFLAVARDLRGEHQRAVDEWLALLEETPIGAPWEGDLARTIEQVGAINRIAVADRLARVQAKRRADTTEAASQDGAFAAVDAIPGPSSAQVAAASAIPPAQQREMAEAMVARLENRLGAEPGNTEGWVMLMRSRMTLGQPDLARKALADGIAANPAAAEQLRVQAETLGLR